MEVIEAKVEGREVVAPEEPEETNLVDLMAALQASVENAKKARSGGAEPVSVEEAKRKREARGGSRKAEPKKESAATAKRAGKGARGEEAGDGEEVEERPARRRKSA
jgi:DNA end-binding protein Ku